MATILITGGAGYIGSHTVLEFLEQTDHEIVILDNLVYGHEEVIARLPRPVELVKGDIGNAEIVRSIFSRKEIDAVIHFAAFAYVGESVSEPLKYYQNNLAAPLQLLQVMTEFDCQKFIFSSTCATYGIPEKMPITESTQQNPINPYGRSKWMLEQVLKDVAHANGIESVMLRYFNASGSDPKGRIGEDHNPEPHLIPRALMAATGEIDSISVFGTDYPTEDGTCIRDYIHVSDLARAHRQALEYLDNGGETAAINLGTGKGTSVNEIIEAVKTVTGVDLKIEYGPRREGDPPVLVAAPDKAKELLGWEPVFENIEDHINAAWLWFKESRHYADRCVVADEADVVV